MTQTPYTALALAWYNAGRKPAIATVIETWGSAPRPVGSLMVIDANGAFEGSVSGGCVEAAVISQATAALIDGKPRVLDFGVSDDDAFGVGLACGGTIRILVEPVGTAMPVALLTQIVAAGQDKTPIAYVVDLQSDVRQIAQASDYPVQFRLDQSGIAPDGRLFIGIHTTALRVIIVGAVHIAQHLAPMAQACGYAPVIIDPRGAFGSADRFAGHIIDADWPDVAVARHKPDTRTAVVTLTHDPKLDDPAIIATLGSDAFYLGCLGATRTHAKRVLRLQAAGISDDQIARIHAPVGLNIGSKTPAEIAISIMAQITDVRRR